MNEDDMKVHLSEHDVAELQPDGRVVLNGVTYEPPVVGPGETACWSLRDGKLVCDVVPADES